MNSLAELSLREAASAVASGRHTSRELVDACLSRIDQWQSRINAFIYLAGDSARATADGLDLAARRESRRRAAVGVAGWPGGLGGVPLAHKDMFYRAGRHSSLGTAVQPGRLAERTSTLLARLDAAGAIELGRLNMSEFALGPTGHNLAFGDCRNPWHSEHVAGGSSSGGAAAVAARLVYASLGSDTGGSVRLPASICGVLGLKPTHGRLSRSGMMVLSPSLDVPGIFAREAGDLARVLSCVAGHDPADTRCSRRDVPDFESVLLAGIGSLRIGVPEGYFYDALSDDVARALADARRVLEPHCAGIVTARTPYAGSMSELSRAIVYAEAAALHGRWLREHAADYSPQVRLRAATGLAIPAPVYLQALQLRATLLRRFVDQAFAECDVLLLPTLSIPVPTLAETAVGGGEGMWRTLAAMVRCTAPFNYLGLPALSVPCGFTANGLPTALQLVARPFDECALLRVAHAYQQATDWHRQVPVFGSRKRFGS